MKRARGEASNKIINCFAIFIILVFAFFIFNLAFVNAAYQPPIYIANPETQECKYYFAGEVDCFEACMQDCQGAGWNESKCTDACANQYCHYNPRPEGFTIDLGATTDFKDLNESCKIWQDCLDKNGEWNNQTLKCEPKPQEKKSIESGKLCSSGLNITLLVISIIILIITVLLYMQNKKLLQKIKSEHKEEY